MAKGYSVRTARNYTRGKDGKWRLHSQSAWDSKGYTRVWPTVEKAEEYARERMKHIVDPSVENYIAYCKIYFGKECVKVVNRD